MDARSKKNSSLVVTANDEPRGKSTASKRGLDPRRSAANFTWRTSPLEHADFEIRAKVKFRE